MPIPERTQKLPRMPLDWHLPSPEDYRRLAEQYREHQRQVRWDNLVRLQLERARQAVCHLLSRHRKR